MPAVTISLFPATFIARMTRASLLEVLRQDYIVTARAKGLPEQLIWMRHALLNALPPILTIIGLRLGYMLGGSVIVESIFAWPGMGRLLINSILSRDFPMIRGVLLVFSGMFLVLNLLVDLLTVYFDPRARTN
jgi:ABC-type dipeptide/oligopeptide/nickel transport system permease component